MHRLVLSITNQGIPAPASQSVPNDNMDQQANVEEPTDGWATADQEDDPRKRRTYYEFWSAPRETSNSQLASAPRGSSCPLQAMTQENFIASLGADVPLPAPLPSSTTTQSTKAPMSRPGAFARDGPADGNRSNERVGFWTRQASEEQSGSHHEASISNNMAEAYPVSLPVATAEEVSSTNAKNIGKEARKRFAIVAALVCLAVLLICSSVVTGVVTTQRNNTVAFPSNETLPEYVQMREVIINAFGDDYFDTEEKEDALKWIVFEDPGKQQQYIRNSTSLFQRFVLVAFYFQTSSKQPWDNCNPPTGQQPEICFYNITLSKWESRGIRWLSTAHECQWMGVTCHLDTKSIKGISIECNGLSGSLPSELASLTDLVTIEMGYNRLHGTLPPLLGLLPHLQTIGLTSNHLTGTIPEQYLSIPTLKFIKLNDNSLTGSIPTEIMSSNLSTLSLWNNTLVGSIPETIYSLEALRSLVLSNNKITGTISPLLGRMHSLSYFEANDCDLSGTLPTEIAFAKETPVNLYLERNRIDGTIPEEIYAANVLGLGLSGNRLTGTISTRLGYLSDILVYDVADNDLSGTVPAEISKLTHLSILSISGNRRLTGSIPEVLCSQNFQSTAIMADCLPEEESEIPAVFCPEGCCSLCCDAKTGICRESY